MSEQFDGGLRTRALRVGIVNLMPRLETYEPSLCRLFQASEVAVEPVWIRLGSHGYTSSDPRHLEAHYVAYDRAIRVAPLDGLVLTGAPVEKLSLGEVRYWPELSELLDDARQNCSGTLGICWGGMALAEREGLTKEVYPRKIFGLFEHAFTERAAAAFGMHGPSFLCPQSRFAGFSREAARAADADGRIRLLAEGGDAGPTLLQSIDGRVVMHLGHPEYEASRLGYEWRRDEAAGLTDVAPPYGYDLATDRPYADWGPDSAEFMRAWLRRLRHSTPLD